MVLDLVIRSNVKLPLIAVILLIYAMCLLSLFHSNVLRSMMVLSTCNNPQFMGTVIKPVDRQRKEIHIVLGKTGHDVH